MNIVKISNIRQHDGNYDYKGLDLSRIVAGSQLYPDYDNAAYFLYEGEVNAGEDVELISQSSYDAVRIRIDNMPKPIMDTDRIDILEGIVFEAVMEGKI